MTHICSQSLFCNSFKTSIQTAASLENISHYEMIFWIILQKNSSLLVFTQLDGIYESYRHLINPEKTLVLLLPYSKDSETQSPYIEFHPSLIRDEKLKQCDIEKITYEEMKYICDNNKFPKRISDILKNE